MEQETVKGCFAVMLMVGFMIFASIGVVGAQETTLEAGDVAPPFSLPGSDGATYSLRDLRGQAVVLAWFPKAFTGG